MFKPVERAELNQISVTGMRSIVLLGLLIVAPRSLEEIREAFLELNIIEDSHSNDILRIDLNTLKAMGCEISRASAKTDYKYVLSKHPFSLKIGDEEIKVLKRVYKKIKLDADLSLLIDYHELFEKLAGYIYEDNTKEALLGISVLKSFDINLLKELIVDCKQEKVLELAYKKPTAKLEERKEIVAQKLVFKNDKIYLYGFDFDSDNSIVLNVKRIRAIFSKKLNKKGYEPKLTKIKYHLKSFGVETITEGETILEASDDGYIIEGEYHNEFLAMQRVLSFGANCTVLEPVEFREMIINKLKEMRKAYGC